MFHFMTMKFTPFEQFAVYYLWISYITKIVVLFINFLDY